MKGFKYLIVLAFIVSNLQAAETEKFLCGWETVKKGEISHVIRSFGKLIAEYYGYVYAPMPGKLLEYTKPTGSFVRKDEPIAYIDRSLPGMKMEPLVVKAPFDGYILIEYAHKGDMVAQQIPLAMMGGGGKMVELNLTQSNLIKVKAGMQVSLGKEGELGKGIVKEVSRGVDVRSGTGIVRVGITKLYKNVPYGSLVMVNIAVETHKNTLIVPLEALVEREGKYFIFKYENGRARKIEVKKGIVSGQNVEIFSNMVHEGDTIITTGSQGLYDNAPVELLKGGGRK